jgi:putative addiction module component (TIGR02574 family)
MDPVAEKLLDAALRLPDEERLQMAEALIVSLQAEDRPPFDESWREVINARSEEIDSGRVRPLPRSEVKLQG